MVPTNEGAGVSRENLIVDAADLLAKRWGFHGLIDVRPAELRTMLLDDAEAIVEWHLTQTEKV